MTQELATKTLDALMNSEAIVPFNFEPIVEDIYTLISACRSELKTRENFVHVKIPSGGKLIVVGDVHGQNRNVRYVWTLSRQLAGNSESAKVVFNGDFVDKGPQSLDVIVTLMCLLLLHPEAVFLNRGNHETRYTTKTYGFLTEIQRQLPRHWQKVYERFMDLFQCIPLGCVIEGDSKKMIVLHAGVPTSPACSEPVSLSDMQCWNRFVEIEPVENSGTSYLQAVLWDDPGETPGLQQSERKFCRKFGPDKSEEWLMKNDLVCLIRSHEEIETVRVDHGGQVVTVFSGHQELVSVLVFTADLEYEIKRKWFPDNPNAYCNLN